MKMRHFWRWPVLCSVLFGLASAGSAAGSPSSLGSEGRDAPVRSGTQRLAHDARLHARVETIRTAMRDARAARQRPAVLRSLADRVEAAAGRMIEDSRAFPATESVVEVLLADLYAGADALRSGSKAARTAGLARIDGALQDYQRRFDPPSGAGEDARVLPG